MARLKSRLNVTCFSTIYPVNGFLFQPIPGGGGGGVCVEGCRWRRGVRHAAAMRDRPEGKNAVLKSVVIITNKNNNNNNDDNNNSNNNSNDNNNDNNNSNDNHNNIMKIL